jgi:transcription antitermination factor NusG
VAEHLTRKSLEAYLPVFSSRRRWSDRTKTIQLPLFPRYVFCRFGFEQRLDVLGTPNVTAIVGFGGRPCPVTEDEMESLKRIVDSNLPICPWPFVRMGQRVRIREGPLVGLEGILAREKAAYRVVVNVEMLARAVCVEVEREILELVTSPGQIATSNAAHLRSRV